MRYDSKIEALFTLSIHTNPRSFSSGFTVKSFTLCKRLIPEHLQRGICNTTRKPAKNLHPVLRGFPVIDVTEFHSWSDCYVFPVTALQKNRVALLVDVMMFFGGKQPVSPPCAVAKRTKILAGHWTQIWQTCRQMCEYEKQTWGSFCYGQPFVQEGI